MVNKSWEGERNNSFFLNHKEWKRMGKPNRFSTTIKINFFRDTCTPMFIAVLFTIARTWMQPRCPSTDEWIKELWYIYTMEYYSAIKEWIWVHSNEVDESRTYYTEGNKSEREKQVSYTNAYVWNLERLYWWTYLQVRNRDIDIENGLDTVREGENRRNGQSSIDIYIYTLPCVK